MREKKSQRFKMTTILSVCLLLVCISICAYSFNSNSRVANSTTKREMWPFDFMSKQVETGIPIIDAVLTRNLDTVTAVLSRDPTSVNAKAEETGSNAMHIIAKQGHYKFPPEGIPKTLIDYKININEKNNDNKTALEISLLSGWQKIAMLLLDNGADRSVVTNDIKQRITCPDCKRVVKQYNL